MASYAELEWHSGEKYMQKQLRVPYMDNPTSSFLHPFAISVLRSSPLLALGTLDNVGRPWTSLWFGERGFAAAAGEYSLRAKGIVDRSHDPVTELLVQKMEGSKELKKEDRDLYMISGLAIDLENRRRVKLAGNIAQFLLSRPTKNGFGEASLEINIEQTLGNCPKYLNKKHLVPTFQKPKLVSTDLPLPVTAVEHIEKADCFFMSSTNNNIDMDTNYRGGPAGFCRLLSNTQDSCVLIYPEYSGNRLYQSLGNLTTTPKAGLVIPNFDTGDVLYLTGATKILVGEDSTAILPRVNLSVMIIVQDFKFVVGGLPFRAERGEDSPYNPPIRFLAKELQHLPPKNDHAFRAKLVERTYLTPTVARFRFSMSNHLDEKAPTWEPGQCVTLSFEKQLGRGYSHMRDSNPQSLNDDYIRTFTVSSHPEDPIRHNEFELTIRNVGVVTDYLFSYDLSAKQLEIQVKGFSGEFNFARDPAKRISFLAGGIGITPVLAQAKDLDSERFLLFWMVRGEDLGLVEDTFKRLPLLARSCRLFVTGICTNLTERKRELEKMGVVVRERRLAVEDLELERRWDENEKWYLCAGSRLQKLLATWLVGRTVIQESFSY